MSTEVIRSWECVGEVELLMQGASESLAVFWEQNFGDVGDGNRGFLLEMLETETGVFSLHEGYLPRMVAKMVKAFCQGSLPYPLDAGGLREGKGPFRFENIQLKEEGFKELVADWLKAVLRSFAKMRQDVSLKAE
ncbi:hypothetical protein CK203_105340 [Vitis vinifera]|uniref:Uncharacterized protein n=1 Tax=Vitis vinifera TaxID=29760 RepID=A0A438CY31_VITVI|nr:hypothetical protein CK203_105340 [Vitis vinifera]